MAQRQPVSPGRLESSSTRLVLECLLERPQGITRPELARSIGLTNAAITSLVAADGGTLAPVLHRTSTQAVARGRRPEVLQVKPTLGHVFGIVLGHTNICVALADLRGAHADHCTRREDWPVEDDLHGAIGRAGEIVQELADTSKVPPEEIAAIGLAVAAPVHVVEAETPSYSVAGAPLAQRATLRLDLGPNRRESQWLNIDPLAALRNHLAAHRNGERWRSVPIHADNDANLGALAELRLGAGRGSKNLLYVKVDEGGIGAALAFDGEIYRGSGGIAGELGHVVLDSSYDAKCLRCGRPCVEAVIGSILGYEWRSRTPSLDEFVRAVVRGDPASRDLVREAASYLGRALAGFVTLLNVDHILIGGPFPAQAYPFLIPPVMKELDLWSVGPVAQDYVLELGALRDDGPLEGAIWLALECTRVDYLLRLCGADQQT